MYLKASKHMNVLTFLLVIIISELLLVKGLKLCPFPVMSFANNSSAKNTGINVNSNNLLSLYIVGLLGCNAMQVFVCAILCLLTVVFWNNDRVEASSPAAVVSRITRGKHHPLQPRILTTAQS